MCSADTSSCWRLWEPHPGTRPGTARARSHRPLCPGGAQTPPHSAPVPMQGQQLFRSTACHAGGAVHAVMRYTTRALRSGAIATDARSP